MKQYIFSGFKYELGFTPTKQQCCVTVIFTCNGQLIKRYVFIPKSEGVNYINEAKKIIERERANGKLAKYVDKYNRRSHRSVIAVISAVFVAAALTLAGVATYKYLTAPTGGGFTPTPILPEEVKFNVNDSTGYKVDPEVKSSTVAKEYKTKIDLIPINPAPTKFRYLPESLDSVTSGETTLSSTDYEYILDESATSANLTIPATFVTGKLTITLTLTDKKPVKKVNVLASGECEGVKVPKQQIDGGVLSSFSVNVIPNHEGDVVFINKIETSGQTFLLDTDYDSTLTVENTYYIYFKYQQIEIKEDITITATTMPAPVDRTLTLDSQKLGFYNETEEPLENEITFKSNQGSKVYIKAKEGLEQSKVLPLKLDIVYKDNGRDLILGKDYEYHFVRNDMAELTIAKGDLGDVTVKADPIDGSDIAAMFIINVPSNTSNSSITFGFDGINADTITINWGDSTTETSYTWDSNGYHSFGHSYEAPLESDKEYLITLKTNKNHAPDFGFDIYDDKVGATSDAVFSPNEEIAPYSSSIRNITAIKLTDNIFTKFTAEGLIHTSINSLYIPSGMTMDGKYISYCDNLSTFYVGGSSPKYEVDGENQSLYEYVDNPDPSGNDSYNLIASLSTAVVLNEFKGLPIKNIKPYACVGRKNLTTLSIGPDLENYGYGAIIDCPNLSQIDVDDNNTTYITNGDVGYPVNMVAKQKDDKYEVATLLLAIKNTLLDGEEFTAPIHNIEKFAFSGSNVPEEFVMREDAQSAQTLLGPYSFYHATNLHKLKVGDLSFVHGGECCDPIFYGCDNLGILSINKEFDMPSATCPVVGVIQKCPKLQIQIRNEQSTDIDTRVYVYNNAIYYLDASHNATLIGTTLNSSIANSFNAGNNTYTVKKFVNCVFNGNGVKEIYIPSGYDCDSTNYPFVGCDGAMFTSNSERGFIDTRVDEDGIPIQSIFYIKDNNDKFVLVGTSLLNNNKTLAVPENINIIGSHSISCSPVEKIIFERKDDGLDTFNNYAIFGCHNLTELNFSELSAQEADDIPELSSTHAIEDNDYYLTHIAVLTNGPVAVELFKANAMWARFTNIRSEK